ncbi:pheromone A receptor-domain-containing protein [Boletus reticuloceps]|uniref:Pheromone A receptor-domain-containing protein n=1 Tax=Boletus reticuloceps TaxID=495285 RepID=A0A8I2YVE5_9AGAM|nr:pheromone A receptor-domain-containing protein [Boletus reticuloceps]
MRDNIIFIVLMGIVSLLVVIPLPKVLVSGNVGTSMLIIWTEVACLVQFANAIRWNGNIKNWAPVWCDFCGHFFIVVDFALVACSLSINRRLYLIVTMDRRRQKKVTIMVVDSILCLVLPWVALALQYVVQQYRFLILEDVGCYPGVGTVILAFPLVWMLPLCLGTVSTGYACLTIRERLRRKHGVVGETGMSSAWNRRVMIVALVTILFGLIPTSMCMALLATAYGVTPWPGWRAIHSTVHIIVYVPALEWRSNPTRIASVELRRWTTVTLAFMIFVILGLTTDVKKMYLAWFRSAIDSFGQTSTSSRTVLERNADSNVDDQKAHRSSRSSRFSRNCLLAFGKPHAESPEENTGLTDRPRLDSDPGGFKLVFPASLPDNDATHSTDPSWKVHFEGDDYPDPSKTKSSNHFDQVLQKV